MDVIALPAVFEIFQISAQGQKRLHLHLKKTYRYPKRGWHEQRYKKFGRSAETDTKKRNKNFEIQNIVLSLRRFFNQKGRSATKFKLPQKK